MKRLAALALVFALAGCSSAKEAAEDAENKVKAKGACLILKTLQKSYDEANSGEPLSDSAAGEFKNALEALKPLVPAEVQDSVSTLRATQTPVNSSQYTPEQAQARQELDTYFQNECGAKLN